MNKEDKLIQQELIDEIMEASEHYPNAILYMQTLMEHYEKLEKENKQLKDNWKQLKQWLETSKIKEFEKSYGKRYGKTFIQAEIIVFNMIKEKIKELEGVKDE